MILAIIGAAGIAMSAAYVYNRAKLVLQIIVSVR